MADNQQVEILKTWRSVLESMKKQVTRFVISLVRIFQKSNGFLFDVFNHAELYLSDLHGTNLVNADLGGATLVGLHLCDANLQGASLAGADLGSGTSQREPERSYSTILISQKLIWTERTSQTHSWTERFPVVSEIFRRLRASMRSYTRALSNRRRYPVSIWRQAYRVSFW